MTQAAIGNVIKTRHLSEIAMGYARSRVLSAAARLGLADALEDQERTISDLASRCAASESHLYRLLRALASFAIVRETEPGKFMLAPLGQPLRKDHPNSEWADVIFWGDLLADSWSHLTECVRTGSTAADIMQRDGLPSRWARDPDANSIFRAVMGTAPNEDYMAIARTWDFSRARVVADLGGGGGALLAAVLESNPDLRGMLVDRPEAIERARSRFQSCNRCELIAADLCQSIPQGADVLMMKHVLHGYDDTTAITVLQNCRQVLPENGRLLIIEFVLPDLVTGEDAELEKRLMSDINMLAVTGGKERNATEWKSLLNTAGYDCIGIMPVKGDLVSIVEIQVALR